MADLFVGRRRELRESLDALAIPGEGAVRDIVGVRGVGKSSFLQRLADRARHLELPGREISVYTLDMRRHGLGVGFPPGDLGANASLDIVREVFATSRQLMGSLAGDARVFKGFRSLSQRLWREATMPASPAASVTIGKRASIGEAEIRVTQDDAAFRQHIRVLQSQLDDGFAEAWGEFAARRQVLITVDTFQLAADNELGQWFIRMAGRLRNTLTVLARTPSDVPLWREGTGVEPMELPFFSVDEVADYLRRRLGTSAPPGELAAITHDFTGGHPEGMNLVGNLIMNSGGAELRAAELRRMLDSLPGEGDQFWAGLVVEILHATRGDDLPGAVEAASAAGIFDARLLAELIDPENPREAEAGKIIARLSGLRMLHPVPAISGGPPDRFRLHEFIRQSVAFRLRASAPGEWRRLQSVVAQHYFRRLEKWEREPYGSYGAWYRFEDPDWQECKREWLRHSGLASDRSFVTRARFTLVFLEAFWWWGYYVSFPFMRGLLDDWARVSAGWARAQGAGPVPLGRGEDPDRLLPTVLAELIGDYPETHIKPRTSPWDAIRDNLIKVRVLCGLSPVGGLSPAARRLATAEEQATMIRADAFITLFLAHSRRFRDPEDPSAERFYEAALTAFRDLGDEWTTAWLVFERSDMALERRDLRVSGERLAEGAALVKQLASRTGEWDRELLANLHRTWADVCWLSDRPDMAARQYGRAVAHAYWFHGEPSAVDGEPHGPDQYTRQFYREMTLRAAERMAELAGRPARMERFVGEMLREIPRDATGIPAADLADATTSELRELLFPPEPTDDELLRVDTPFMERWSTLYLGRQDPLAGLEELIRIPLTE
ncbi:MAG: ATP-binding protein [Nocardiopsaceae bacterium]|nr:ATP-binding protein [Nocardiopsaceae bacterium]